MLPLKGKPKNTWQDSPETLYANKEIEGMGGKVTAQYAVLGIYDFVNVVEAPDNETIARISVELGSRGTLQIMTLPAIPIETFAKKVRTK